MNHSAKKIGLAVALGLFLFSCESRHDLEILEQETERIHDDAMRDMAEMNRIGRSLKKDTAGTVTRRDSIAAALLQMTDAEADMMAWMTGYRAPKDKPKAEAIQYLTEQKTKIEQNQKDIRAALEAGKTLVKK
jgi:succinate dehydrogenase flavin-adding protein (antitoxin of CptAB toxin-antitoxin module)